MIAAVGLALTACGGHHDDNKDQSAQPPADPVVTTTHTETEHKETKTEEPTEHKEPKAHKETVHTEKGAPKVDTADAVKPKAESTMGSAPTKHPVKPGGVQGTK